jgi:hypothetical protein
MEIELVLVLHPYLIKSLLSLSTLCSQPLEISILKAVEMIVSSKVSVLPR